VSLNTTLELSGAKVVAHNRPRLPQGCRMTRKLGRFVPSVIDFEIDIAVAEATDTICSGVDNLPAHRHLSPLLRDFCRRLRR
jgi:hypothetical protein